MDTKLVIAKEVVDNGVILLKLRGQFEEKTSAVLSAGVCNLIEGGHLCVILDLNEIKYLKLEALVGLMNQLSEIVTKVGLSSVVVGVSEKLRDEIDNKGITFSNLVLTDSMPAAHRAIEKWTQALTLDQIEKYNEILKTKLESLDLEKALPIWYEHHEINRKLDLIKELKKLWQGEEEKKVETPKNSSSDFLDSLFDDEAEGGAIGDEPVKLINQIHSATDSIFLIEREVGQVLSNLNLIDPAVYSELEKKHKEIADQDPEGKQ